MLWLSSEVTGRCSLNIVVTLLTCFSFYTVDYTPQNLTNWGFQAAGYDVDVNGGGVFYKLVLNALPNHYAKNSIYVHQPLTVPDENKVIMKNLKKAYLYDFSKPTKQPVVPNITSFEACKTLFQNAATSTSLSAIAPSSIVVDEQTCQKSATDAQTLTAFRNYLTTKPNKKYITQFFKNVTTDLLQKHSYKLAGTPEVDIIRDVSNLAQVHFAACIFALPLKTDSNPDGAFEASELWTILTALFSSIHTTSNPVEAFSAQIAAQGALKGLGEMVVNNVKAAHPEKRGWIEWGKHLLESHQHTADLTDQSAHLIQEMIKTGVKPENLTYNYLLPIAAAIVVSQARAFADCLTYILPRDGKSDVLSTVQKLAAADTEQADAQIEHVVLEALRMNAKTSISVTPASSVSVTEGGKSVVIAPNQTVLCDVVSVEPD